jgi:hypothetical protein
MEKNKKTSFKVTSSVNDGIKSATIHLSKNLTLEETEDVKLLMIQNLDKYQSFSVVLGDVENIDLGMIQLFYSFKWTAERKSKKVFFDISLNEDNTLLLEHAGFSELLKK